MDNQTNTTNELLTERLVLRKWRESDAEDLYLYAKDPAVGPIAGWPPHESVEHSLEIIRTVFAMPETYAVCLREDDRPIGSIGLIPHDFSDLCNAPDEAEIGYWVGVPFWGKGIIPEASRALIRHGFEDLGLTRIWACYTEGNAKSRRVMEKCGFVDVRVDHDVSCELMNDVRTNYVMVLEKNRWE